MKKEYKEIYDLCKKHNASYELMKDLEILTDKIIERKEANENISYYDFLVDLQNSINNAGHEDRRSQDIKKINDKMHYISSNYLEED